MGFRTNHTRMRACARRRFIALRPESGFTLVEILVVMIILGLLAAIAIPTFLSQTAKAGDTRAKAQARTMATAIETCRTDTAEGTYDDCGLSHLRQIEPTIPADAQVPLHDATSYVVESAPAEVTGNRYRIKRVDGDITRACTIGDAGKAGGCNVGSQSAAAGVDGTW